MTSGVLDAAYLTAQKYPGGARALAGRMGVNAAVLSHKLNPNNQDNHLTVNDLITIMVMSADHSAMHAICRELGYMALPLPSVDCEDATAAITATVEELADYLKAVTTTLKDGKVTKLEMRKVRKELADLVAQAGKLEAILASKEAAHARK